MTRDNYYILLDLDPFVDDLPTINTAIKQKQIAWSKLRNHPTKSNWANQKLKSLDDIKRLMWDARLRKTEAKDAEKILLRKQKKLFKELDEAISFMSLKGYIMEDEIKQLQKKSTFKKFTIKDIEARITIEIRKTTTRGSRATDSIKPIDKTIMARIEAALQLIGKTDLYDFLGITKASSLTTIKFQIDKIDRANKMKASKTAEVTSIGELIGHCKSILIRPNEQKRYHKTLALQKFKDLDRLIELAGSDGVIRPNALTAILKHRDIQGLTKQEVVEYIEDYCQKKKWVFQPTEVVLNQLQDCASCGGINPKTAKVCGQCAFPLEVKCPRCQYLNEGANKTCTQCSFSIGDMANALPLIARGKAALLMKDYKAAKIAFDLANNYWESHPDIVDGLNKIHSKNQKETKLERELADLITKNKYYSARRQINLLKKIDASNPIALGNEKLVLNKVQEAEKMLQQAKFTTIALEKEEFLSKALLIANDCTEAERLLNALPPNAPTNLSCSVSNNAIQLSWKAVKAFLPLKYRIIRKLNVAPIHPTDGDLLTEITDTKYLDLSVSSGQFYYYAVFTNRENIFSIKGAISKEVLLTAPIEALKVQPGNKEIKLVWKAPPNVLRIEVRAKKATIPTNHTDGMSLPNVKLDGVTHDGLTNNSTYGYLVIPVFKGKGSQEIYGAGAKIKARPVVLPEPISMLALEKKGTNLSVSWENKGSQVTIFYAEQEMTYAYNQIVDSKILTTTMDKMSARGTNTATLPLARVAGILYIYPVTTLSDISVMGSISSINPNLVEVINLKGQIAKNNLHLTWDYPAAIDFVRIDLEGLHPTKKIISHEVDHKMGGVFTTACPTTAKEVKILVRTKSYQLGKDSYSLGEQLSLLANVPRVQFSIKKKPKWKALMEGQNYELIMKWEGNLKVPLTFMVGEEGPLKSIRDENGISIEEIHEASFQDQQSFTTSFNYEPMTNKHKKYFCLFPKKAAHAKLVAIQGNNLAYPF